MRRFLCIAFMSIIFFAVNAEAKPYITFSSPEQIAVGETITSEVMIYDITDCKAYQVLLEFNETDYITANSNSNGSFLADAIKAKNLVDPPGEILMTYALMDGSETGSGQLFTTSWTGVADGVVTIRITTLKISDSLAQKIETDPFEDFSITVGNPPPTITASSTSQTITESTPTISLTANLSSSYTADTTVTLTASGTASLNTDYTLNTTLTVPAGVTSTTQEIITLIDDISVEGTETIILTMTDPVNGTIGSPSQYTICITDDDKPTVNWSMSSQSISESSGTVTITATMDQSYPSTDVVIPYSVSGTASADSDFSSPSGSLTIPAGTLSKSLTISITDDTTTCETDETIILTITQPDDAHLGTTIAHTITITANDPTINWRDSMTNSATEGDSLIVYADLCVPIDESVSITYSVSGTVSSGDHNLTDSTLTVDAGASSISMTLQITDDTTIEDPEDITLTMSNPVNATLSSPTQYTLAIADDDEPTVNWSAATQTVSETSTIATITATLDQAYPSTAVVVSYTISGSATADDDFVDPSGSLTIPGGVLQKSFDITINDDSTTCESDETIVVTMSKPSNASLGTTTEHTVTIAANDPTVTWQSGMSTTSNEGDSFDFIAELCISINEDISVPYTVAGTASSSDHDLTDNSLTFTAGSTSETVTVRITDDSITCESDETIIAALDTSSLANVYDGTLTSHTLTIGQNDPVISWTSTDTETSEGSTIQMAVSSCVQIDSDITIPVTTSGTVATTDYSPEITSIVIPASQQTASISVTATDDTETCEADETLMLTLGKPANAYTGADMARTITITKNDPDVQWVTTSQNASEGDILSISAEICMAMDQDIDITVSASGPDASDYNVGTLTIPANATQGNLSATIIDDATDCEDTETLTLTISDDTDYYAGTNNTHDIAISADDPVISWTTTQQTVSENVNIVSITATTCLQQDQPIEIPYTISGTASSSDHSLTDGTFSIPANSDTGELTFTVTPDTLVEQSETISIQIGSITGADTGTPDTHEISITDDDLPYLTISSAQSSVSESAGTVMITVTADQSNFVDMEMDYTISGTADSSDHNLASGTLSITASETTNTILLSIQDDNRDEAEENVVITLSNAQNAIISGGTTALTIAITDNDTPVVQFSSSSQNIGEASGTVSLDVTMDILSDFDITIPYTLGGSAQTSDYTLSGGDITITSGSQTSTLSVPINDDSEDEPLETLLVYLNSPDKATVGTTNSHTISIEDNDIPIVDWSATSITYDENDGSIDLTVNMDRVSYTDVIIDISVTGGDATESLDYTLAAQSITIVAGQQSADLSVIIGNDDDVEPNETFEIALNSSTNAQLGTSTQFTVTIRDDDITQVEFVSTTQTILEDAQTIALTVQLNRTSYTEINIPFVIDGSSTADASDHDVVNGTITVPSNTLTISKTYTLTDDTIDEADETIVVNLQTPDNAILGTNQTQTITITDDDTPVVQFSSSSQNIDESAGTVTIDITMDILSDFEIIIPYTLGGSTQSSDYTLSDGDLTIAAGSQTTQLTVPINEDQTDEPKETLIVYLNSPDKADLGTKSNHTISITDNDIPTVEWSTTSTTFGEDVGTVNLTVNMDLLSYTDVTIDISVTDSNATESLDYTLTAQSITIVAGQQSADLSVIIGNDEDDESNETFEITMENSNNAQLGASQQTTITIQDDDIPEVEFVTTTQTIMENAQTISLTVQVNRNSYTEINIPFEIDTASTADALDHDIVNGTITILPNTLITSKTFTVNNDEIDEADELIVINLQKPDNADLGVNMSQTITITDNDVPKLTFQNDTDSENESAGTVSAILSLDIAPYTTVTIDYTVSGSMTETDDYEAISGSAEIAANNQQVSIDIVLEDDEIDEPQENLVIELQNVTNASLSSPNIYTLTVSDNDTPIVNWQSTSQSADEGVGAISLTAQMDIAPYTDALFEYTVSGSASTDDYTLAAGSFTITANTTMYTLSVEINEDELVESHETIIVTLTQASQANIGLTSVHTIFINDNDTPKLAISPLEMIITEAAGTIALTATLDKPSYTTVRANIVVSGNSISGEDYIITISTISIPANATQTILNIDIIDTPTSCEDKESLIVSLSHLEFADPDSITQSTVWIYDICPSFEISSLYDVFYEDAGEKTISSFASQITSNTPFELPLSFEMDISDTALFAVNPAISEDGTLTYTPEDDLFGSSTVTITLKSGAHVGEITTSTILIRSVNDAPSFTMPQSEISVDEDSDFHLYTNWLTQILPGPDNESDQELAYHVISEKADLFDVAPDIEEGDLTFTLASNQNGEVTVAVLLQDNGGRANGGSDTSMLQFFKITVNPVNDPPENTVLPSISGVPQKDQTISSTNGDWNDNADITPGTLTYTYQWQQASDGAGTFTDISGATDSTLTLLSSTIDSFIRLKLTCSDDGEGGTTESVSVVSNVIGSIQDLPNIWFDEMSEVTFLEDAGEIQIPIRIEKPLIADAEYVIEITGTASEGDDFHNITKTRTIPAGASSAYLTLSIIDDTDDEDLETIIITLTSATRAQLGDKTQVDLSIKASDATPTISDISPNSGYVGNQTLIKVTGTNFMQSVNIQIDNVDALNVVRESDTVLHCNAPVRNDLVSNTNVDLTVINPGGQIASTTFTYETMRTISGQVLADDSNPITNCVVSIELDGQSWYTVTNNAGNYSITDLPISDMFIVSAWPDANQDLCYQSEYFDNTDKSNATAVSTTSGDATVNFSLSVCDNGIIEGSVHDFSNAPITNGTIQVAAYSDNLGESKIADVDTSGNYEIKGLKPATDYRVCAEWSETVTTEYCYTLVSTKTVGVDIPDTCSVIDINDGRTVPVNGDTTSNIDIIIDSACSGGKISGQIVKCDGTPAANVYVFARSDYFGIESGAQTGSNGQYEINALIPVTSGDAATKGYIVGVAFTGYPTQYYGNTVILSDAHKVSADSTGIDIQQNCYGISGQVTDTSGGVSNVFILAWSASQTDDIYSCSTDAEGNYTLSNLTPASDYIVFASPMDFAPQYYNAKNSPNQADQVDITGGSESNINFFIECGVKLCGQIFLGNTETPMPEGTPVNISSEKANIDREVLTDAYGNYEICDLDDTADDYIISVFVSGYPIAFYNSAGTVFQPDEAEEISPSATCNKDIVMINGYQIKGKITDNDTMISGISVEAFRTSGVGYASDVCHIIDGVTVNYALEGLVPGTYDVSISPSSNYLAETKQVTIVDADIVLNFDLQTPSRTLSGTIYNKEAGQTIWINAWSPSADGQVIEVQGTGNVPYTITGLKPASNYRVQLSSDDVPDMYYDNVALFSDASQVDLSEFNAYNIDFTIENLNTISGTVDFVGGSSGDQAFVVAFSSTMGSEMAQVTFDQPSYALKVKPASNYAVSVWSSDYQCTPEKIWVDASSGDVPNQNFELSQGLYISGTVLDESGQPVSDLTVEVSSVSTGSKFGTTDPSGEYLIQGLSSINDAIVIVHSDSNSPAFYYSTDGTVRDIVYASTVSTADGNVQNIGLTVIDGSTISGIVVSDSFVLLKNISVIVTSDAQLLRHSVITDDNGLFKFSRLPDGNDYVVTAKPSSTSSYQAQTKERIASGTSSLLFRLSEAFTVSGIVTDSNGDPVDAVEIELLSDQNDYYGYCQTDDTGAYEIKAVPQGFDFILMATSSGSVSYLPYQSEVGRINGNETLDISLTPAFKIWGYIKNASDTPVEGATIKGVSISKDDSMRVTVSDDQGYYELKNIPAASDYIIDVECDNYAQQKKTSQISGTQVNFTLSSAGTVSGYIRNTSNQPIKGVLVEIKSESMDIMDVKATDKNGYYAFTGLTESDLSGNLITDYEIQTASLNYVSAKKTNIKVGDQVNLTLLDASASVITGSVKDASDVKASGKVYVKIYKNQSSGGFIKYCDVESDGDFECSGLDSGLNYQLKIKTKNIGNTFNNKWRYVGTGDTPVTSRSSAHAFSVGDVVDFHYGEDWQ
jgi:hypothetical protein